MLTSLFSAAIRITDVVNAEVTRTRDELDEAIDDGRVLVVQVPLPELQRAHVAWPELHAGEASACMLARQNSWQVLTDDGCAKRLIRKILGEPYIRTTFDVLQIAIDHGTITRLQACDLLERMEEEADFLHTQREKEDFLQRNNCLKR